ncbi:MAG: beta-lactamase family protein [Saprospiraceae bacterium]|nr:beta-lactamase family protein [Saprospiraceae bacterium]
MIHLKHLLQVITLLLLGFFTPKASSQTLELTIDSLILAKFNDPDGPGGVFMVAKAGQPVYIKAFGMANLEQNTRLSSESVFQIGSMTKQFTAIAILMLEEQGKLAVSDAVSKYLPDYPNGSNITLHHLLTHTSGIKDFTKMKALREIAQKELTPEMLVNFFKDEPVDFQPGEKFEYNNSGYALLGYVIELVSGETYENFIQNRIFSPAGMTQSRYASDKTIVLHRANGYHQRENNYSNKTNISYSIPYASGAIMSTALDMLAWQNALNQHRLLKSETTQKAFNSYQLGNGSDIQYGYGWHIKDINGIKSREHGGSIFGYKSMGVYIPEKDLYVLGLSNCDCLSPTQLTRDITALVLNWTGK